MKLSTLNVIRGLLESELRVRDQAKNLAYQAWHGARDVDEAEGNELYDAVKTANEDYRRIASALIDFDSQGW